MPSSRTLRMTIRRCTSIFRGEVNCISATCFLVFVFIIITVTINMTKSPTVLTSLENLNINMFELEKDTENAILIEQDDGNVFIAFRVKEDAEIIKKIKSRRVVKQSVRRPDIVEKTTQRSLTDEGKGASNDSSAESLNVKNIVQGTGTKVSGKNSTQADGKQNELRPTFPFSVQDNPYKINNPKLCKTKSDISFVVIVHSATAHFMRRSSIRETWANYKLFKGLTMRIVFLVGKPEKDSTQALIEHESYVNRDIIQGKFIDSYKNLTHKGVLGLRWVMEYCSEAKIVVKVDDDVFLNVFTLFEKLETDFKNKTREIWCPVRQNNTSLIQRQSGKWKVDDNEFKNLTHFPVTYCNGFFTILTSDIIKEMYEAAKVTQFFWIDDVYLFGLLPAKIGNIKHSQLPNLNLNEKQAIECFEAKNKTCEMLVANAHTDGIMDKLWFSAIRQYKALAHKYSKDELFS